ncbi:hypothetical protein [Bradyrhizobium oligotrophicum]|uniref:hypothetical protein n=1 Tax=Bradyrhizobium oligotrophicum TaxID=44255 RepID=UPI003EBA513A
MSLDEPKDKAITGAAALPGFASRSALQKDSVTMSSAGQSALDALIQARVDAYLERAGR